MQKMSSSSNIPSQSQVDLDTAIETHPLSTNSPEIPKTIPDLSSNSDNVDGKDKPSIPSVVVTEFKDTKADLTTHPLTENSSEVENENTDQLVLQLVFSKLTIDVLKEARLVSKNWNSVASRELGEISEINLNKWKIQNDFEDIPYDDLQLVLITAPISLFLGVSLDGEDFESEKDNIIPFLEEFGKRFTSLSIQCPSIASLKSIIIDLCPNLERLKLTDGFASAGGECQCETESVLDLEGKNNSHFIPRELSLVQIEIVSLLDDESKVFSVGIGLLVSFIKSSPNINSISIFDASPCLEIFKELRNCPNITRKLRSLELNGGYNNQMNSIEDLVHSGFSEEFKYLKIHKKNPLISLLLNKVKKSLKTLILGNDELSEYFNQEIEDDENQEDNTNWEIFSSSDLHTMTEIKVFKFIQSLDSEFGITTLEFLFKMPNLNEVWINIGLGSFDLCLTDHKTTPHTCPTVKRLVLKGTIACIQTFKKIHIIFPNLENLNLDLDTSYLGRDRTSENKPQKWFEKVAKKISFCSSLKSLTLKFDWCDCSDFEEVFKNLKRLKNLECLSLQFVHDLKDKASSFNKGVLQIPTLRKLQMANNVSMKIQDAKELLEKLSEQNILLQFIDDATTWN